MVGRREKTSMIFEIILAFWFWLSWVGMCWHGTSTQQMAVPGNLCLLMSARTQLLLSEDVCRCWCVKSCEGATCSQIPNGFQLSNCWLCSREVSCYADSGTSSRLLPVGLALGSPCCFSGLRWVSYEYATGDTSQGRQWLLGAMLSGQGWLDGPLEEAPLGPWSSTETTVVVHPSDSFSPGPLLLPQEFLLGPSLCTVQGVR